MKKLALKILPEKWFPCLNPASQQIQRENEENVDPDGSVQGIEAVLHSKNKQEQRKRAIQQCLRLEKFQDFRSPLQQREKPVQQHQATNNTTQPETMESDCVCAICLDSFEVNQTVALSKNDCCRHAFHQACITEWLLKHEECPCCRSKLLVRGDMLETEEENNERLQEGLRTFDRLQGDELAPPNFAVSVEEASSSP